MATTDILIAQAQVYARDLADAAKAANDAAVSQVQAVGYIFPNYQSVTLPDGPGDSLDLTLPVLDPIDLLEPTEPGQAPEYQDIATIDVGNAPTLGAAPPVLVMPSKPNQLAEFQDSAPNIDTDLPFPVVPALLENPPLDLPSMPDRQAPTAPQITLPAFTAQAPIDTTVAPTDLDQQFEKSYRNALPQMVTMATGYAEAWQEKTDPGFHARRASMEAQLAKYLAGGTGLNPAVEAAIYERDRDRIAGETRRVQDATLADFADRGFTLPPGALFAALNQGRQAGADNLARASNTIATEQAKAEQENLKFALSMVSTLHGVMVNATLAYMGTLAQINGQAMDFAKSVLSSLIEVYNISVKVFAAKLDAYRAEAVVYETRLKGALAAVELYKAEIDALQALTNVDRARVDVYRARIDALNSLANVFKAQVDAVLGKASLEKMKIDVFQARVQAFSAMVQAKNGEWNAYQAQLQGEGEKVRVYTAQVQAHSVNVQAWRGRIEALAESVRAQAISNQARGDQYRAQLSAYGAIVEARGSLARTKISLQGQQIDAFRVSANLELSKAQFGLDYYKTASTVAMENAKNNLTAQLAQADSAVKYGASIAALANGAGATYGRMGSAALSGMNTLVSQQKIE